MDRSALFIDGAYLDKLLQHEFNQARIDMNRLAAKLANDTDLLRTYYYHCPPYQSNPPTEEQKQRTSSRDRFFTALTRLSRFQVRLGKLAFRGTTAEGAPIFYPEKGRHHAWCRHGPTRGDATDYTCYSPGRR